MDPSLMVLFTYYPTTDGEATVLPRITPKPLYFFQPMNDNTVHGKSGAGRIGPEERQGREQGAELW